LTGKTVRQKPHSRSFFDYMVRKVHKVTKVRRDDPKNKSKLKLQKLYTTPAYTMENL
jgi:hypothetical protein